MKSFVYSGELREENGHFYLSAKSLETLSMHEENMRRHKEADRQNRRINLLTFIIAFAAAGQLLWQIFTYFNAANGN